jgi:hypothetical protein
LGNKGGKLDDGGRGDWLGGVCFPMEMGKLEKKEWVGYVPMRWREMYRTLQKRNICSKMIAEREGGMHLTKVN